MFGLDMNVLKMVLVAFATMSNMRANPDWNEEDAIQESEKLIKSLFARYGIDWE